LARSVLSPLWSFQSLGTIKQGDILSVASPGLNSCRMFPIVRRSFLCMKRCGIIHYNYMHCLIVKTSLQKFLRNFLQLTARQIINRIWWKIGCKHVRIIINKLYWSFFCCSFIKETTFDNRHNILNKNLRLFQKQTSQNKYYDDISNLFNPKSL
jgi:hypothetical protein